MKTKEVVELLGQATSAIRVVFPMYENQEVITEIAIEKIQEQQKEIERLRSLVTQARHTLFEKKLITFDEVKSWHETK